MKVEKEKEWTLRRTFADLEREERCWRWLPWIWESKSGERQANITELLYTPDTAAGLWTHKLRSSPSLWCSIGNWPFLRSTFPCWGHQTPTDTHIHSSSAPAAPPQVRPLPSLWGLNSVNGLPASSLNPFLEIHFLCCCQNVFISQNANLIMTCLYFKSLNLDFLFTPDQQRS